MRIVNYRSVHALLLALVLMAMSGSSFAGVFVSVNLAPPALPVYAQPIAPGPGYVWTPGYWAWGPAGYYWVPGTWVMAPVGLLWTPGYWAFSNGGYLWRQGYWGPTVGFYGGINYGYGYPGVGFDGGYWRGRSFYYNRAVTNVNVTEVRNVYTRNVVQNVSVSRVSFNGGNGGINARPTAAEERAAHERHTPPIAVQREHERAAGKDRVLLASANYGRPEIAATAKPGDFNGRGAVAASKAGAPYKPETKREVTPQAKDKGERQVPRPPAADRPNTTSPERNNNKNKGTASNQAARPETEARNHAAPRPGSARPDSTPRRETTARPETSTHRENAPKPENTTRRSNEPAPKSPPHPESKARQEKPSHPDKAPQQQQKPSRPEKNAPPAGGNDRSHEDRPH